MSAVTFPKSITEFVDKVYSSAFGSEPTPSITKTSCTPQLEARKFLLNAGLGHATEVAEYLQKYDPTVQDITGEVAVKIFGKYGLIRLGLTALEFASLKGHHEVVDVLLKHEKVKLNLNQQDRSGMTVLHMAAEKGDHDLVKKFLNAGAKMDVLNKRDLTPFSWALFSGADKCAEAFLRYENDIFASDLSNMMPVPITLCRIITAYTPTKYIIDFTGSSQNSPLKVVIRESTRVRLVPMLLQYNATITRELIKYAKLRKLNPDLMLLLEETANFQAKMR